MTTDAQGELRRALVVTAHPDDVDFGSAGTIAAWTGAGVAVTYCVCTSGDAGGFEDIPRDEMATLRKKEQRAAAEAVGVSDIHFLGYKDGTVTPSLRLREDIARVIRTVRPDRVIAHSPEINWSHVALSHPDHRAVGEATFAAVYPDARNAFAHPQLQEEGLSPWTVPELWLSEAPAERVNHAVDITDHFDAKLEALLSHHSQIAHVDDLGGMLRPELEANARQHGLPAGRLAEVFQVVDTR